jgi:Ricin-type beta-trefoil lectin domain-like
MKVKKLGFGLSTLAALSVIPILVVTMPLVLLSTTSSLKAEDVGTIEGPGLKVAPSAQRYYRLQLKINGKYLDANKCSDQIGLNPGSDYGNGACQLWRFVPADGGYYRLQLKINEKYLDANKCSDQIGLNSGSDYADGACQLWRFIPADGGYYRLQLKINEKYLDANKCSDQIGLNSGSDYADGACQLWRFVPGQ